jgi:hypothetical protein
MTIADIIYYRIAAKHWKTVCQSFKPPETFGSVDLKIYRASIRSTGFWQAEFEGMSEALQKLRASRGETIHITQKRKQTRRPCGPTTGSRVDRKVASSPRRRSKRIESRGRNSTATKSAMPQGIKRRKARARRCEVGLDTALRLDPKGPG